MSANLPAKTTPSTTPVLEPSLRRLLADTLTGEAWKQPDVPPETSKLRAALIELERCILPASGKHVHLCVSKLAVLPTKDGSPIDKALYTDNFVDACGEFPPDIWTTTCIELLKTAKWRPNPADFIAIAQRQLNQRQDMLFRVKQMLTFTPALKAGFVQEPLEVRLRTIRDAHKRHGNLARAAAAELELALLEGRQPEEWAVPFSPDAVAKPIEQPAVEEAAGLRRIGDMAADIAERGYRDASSPESQARLKMALAQKHRKDGRIGYAKTLEAAALKLWPAISENTDNREAAHG